MVHYGKISLQFLAVRMNACKRGVDGTYSRQDLRMLYRPQQEAIKIILPSFPVLILGSTVLVVLWRIWIRLLATNEMIYTVP